MIKSMEKKTMIFAKKKSILNKQLEMPLRLRHEEGNDSKQKTKITDIHNFATPPVKAKMPGGRTKRYRTMVRKINKKESAQDGKAI